MERCPHCSQLAGRHLEHIQTWTGVVYYRCDLCAVVWCVDRHGTRRGGAPVIHLVTEPMPLKEDPR